MKKYCECEDVYENEVYFVETEKDLEKGDLLVVIDYDTPLLVRANKLVDELEAITSDHNWLEALAVVSLRTFFERRKKEIEKAKLIKMMKEQIELQKLEDSLKKNSECNTEMASLYSKYKDLCQ